MSKKDQRGYFEARRRGKMDKRIFAALPNAERFCLEIAGNALEFNRTAGVYKGPVGLKKLAQEATRWLLAHRNSFFIGRGVVVGNQYLAKNQIHLL